MHSALACGAAVLSSLLVGGPALGAQIDRGGHRNTFGTDPVPISMGMGGRPANGPSGAADLSGDNRKTRLAAFHSDASNLVRRDTNGLTDVFVWTRPRGRKGVRLTRPGGTLARASVSSGGAQANGPSTQPTLDGSLRRRPHCVAFQSDATNLSPADGDPVSDVFLRDLRTHKTYLVSRGIGEPATEPSLNGSCTQVAFSAGGGIWVAGPKRGRPRAVGPGSQPDLSLDGSALTWVGADGAVRIRRAGRIAVVAANGGNPKVSDNENGIWGVAFDSTDRLATGDRNSSVDAYTRIVRRSGGTARTDLISAAGRGGGAFGQSHNGGITAYGANRGIIVFVAHEPGGDTLYYRNNHTGNVDDLAFVPGGAGALSDAATSARANFVAFTSLARISRFDRNRVADVYFKHLVDGQAY
jgi:hypothetical protein